MRAALFDAFQSPLSVCNVDSPKLHPDSAIIKVEACGICRSDWHGWMGHDSDVQLPHVPGHELAGVVAEVGNTVTDWRPGQRVTVPFSCGCGICPNAFVVTSKSATNTLSRGLLSGALLRNTLRFVTPM